MIIAETAKKPVKFRFAPSPNGLLHLGHAYSALLAFDLAQKFGGACHLRIEDIDKARSHPDFIAAVRRELHWLGLKWPEPVRRQSEHMQTYQSAIEQLNSSGLVYPCFATRGEISAFWRQKTDTPPRDPDGALIYPGLHKTLSETQRRERMSSGEPFCLRLDMEKALAHLKNARKSVTYISFDENGALMEQSVEPARWGDVIIARKDVPTSYHLAVVVDDGLEGMTHICRGRDLKAATEVHRVLQALLGLPPPLYHHHDLITIKGEKLSKSKGHPSLFDMRQSGINSTEINSAFKKGHRAMQALLTRAMRQSA